MPQSHNTNPIRSQKMENELHRLLLILMTGSREEFKKAKKEIEVLWNHKTEAFKASAHVALEFLPKFDQIEHTTNQVAFASGLKLFFLVLADDYFEILKDFTLKVIQHPNGHVREAIRNTADWLYCSLTSRVHPFMYPKGKKITGKQKDEQAKARNQYAKYIKDIEILIDRYDTDEKNVKYIDEMMPSINKSLQQLWGRLTESYSYQELLETEKLIPLEILIKRKRIEDELVEMLRQTESIFSLRDVKDTIFHEEDNDDMMKIVAMFDRGGDASELSNVLELVTDAWNYFPHKILNGLSPAGKLLDH